MELSDALSDALSSLYQRESRRDWTRPENIADLARGMAARAGLRPDRGNGLLARELGVNIRTVQRWQAGEGKQQRGQKSQRTLEANRARLGAIARRQAPARVAAQIARRGLSVSATGVKVIDPSGNDKKRPPISATIEPDADNLPQLAAHLSMGDPDATAEAFQPAFFEAWAGNPITMADFRIGDVEGISLSIPH